MVKELKVEGVFPVNTYFYIDEKSRHGFLIDPGAQPEIIYEFIKREDLKIEKILFTHGHMDHIGAAPGLQEKLGIPSLIHSAEELYLSDGILNLSDNYGERMTVKDYVLVNDQEKITLESNPDFYLRVLHGPGHTPGSAIFYNEKDGVAFIGDILFEHGEGLSHFPGGDSKILAETIENILFQLPGETILYAGHGEPLTIDEEKQLLKTTDSNKEGC